MVGRLFFFPPPAEEQSQTPPDHHVIAPVAGPQITPNSAKPRAKGSAAPKFPRREPVDSACNLRLRSGIRQSGPPVIEHIFPSAVDIMTNLDHGPHCNL